MITDAASLVLFAVQSAAKLNRQVRQAYVDGTKRRQIVLPLPNFFSGTDFIDAAGFFNNASTGRRFLSVHEIDGDLFEPPARLVRLVAKFNSDSSSLTDDEKDEFNDFHTVFKNVLTAQQSAVSDLGGQAGARQWHAMLTIQQWRKGGDPNPTTLQRIAGTFIEIGVDYALADTELFNRDSSKGKALLGFLNGLNNINFGEDELSGIPARLLVATIETISEHPALLSGDQQIQEFIKVTSESLSTDAATHLQAIDSDDTLDVIQKRDARRNIANWTELVFRSVLSSGGGLIMSQPQTYLGVEDAGHKALISSVGGAVLDVVVAPGNGAASAFTRDGLEKILRAAVVTIGQHPEILSRSQNTGVQKLISGISQELAAIPHLTDPDLLPEFVRIVLDRTGDNLELLWPDLAGQPGKNLLVTAGKTVLDIISRPPAAGASWTLVFSRGDLLAVTEAVLDELTDNPAWLIDDAGELSDVLGLVVEQTVAVIRASGDRRLSSATAIEVVKRSLEAVALRKEWLEVLPNGDAVITGVIAAVFTVIFDHALDARAQWQLVKSATIEGMIETALGEIANQLPSEQAVQVLADQIEQEVAMIIAGGRFDLDTFAAGLEVRLAA